MCNNYYLWKIVKRGGYMHRAALSMVLSRLEVQTVVGMVIMKRAMNVGTKNTTQITEMMKNSAVYPNLGNHIDSSA